MPAVLQLLAAILAAAAATLALASTCAGSAAAAVVGRAVYGVACALDAIARTGRHTMVRVTSAIARVIEQHIG